MIVMLHTQFVPSLTIVYRSSYVNKAPDFELAKVIKIHLVNDKVLSFPLRAYKNNSDVLIEKKLVSIKH